MSNSIHDGENHLKVLNDRMRQFSGDLKHKILTNHVSAICFKLQRGMK